MDAKPADTKKRLGLFDAVGIELEYMLVHGDTLDVAPLCDRLLEAEAGQTTTDVEFDDVSWSNELALHVVELKTTRPVPDLAGISDMFLQHVHRAARHAEALGATMLPTAMHPWMDPVAEMKLWPHENNEIYQTFDRIFSCQGHGWANLQSMHINLPFADDAEFGRLHAAIRLILPILPALAASSPIMESRVTGRLDNRLDAYRRHSARIPSVAGRVIPEPVFAIDQYHEQILERLYADLAPHDPNGILRHEFANARGAIARFERYAIEIRVIDVQECPRADLAIAAAAVGVLKLMVAETWCDVKTQQAWPVAPLADLFERVIGDADRTPIGDENYLRLFGYSGDGSTMAGDLWRHLVAELRRRSPEQTRDVDAALDVLLERGPVARRIVNAAGAEPSRDKLAEVYRRLNEHLLAGEMFAE